MSTAEIDAARISVRSVANRATPVGRVLHALGPVLDRALGIRAIDRFYKRHALHGRSPRAFATAALEALQVRVRGGDTVLAKLPDRGPLIIVANHPHGAIEGLVLTHLIADRRPDLRIMANHALRVFPELAPLCLFVNPLVPRNPANVPGLRESLRHLRGGGVLVLFPASRTSFHRPELGRITDGEWNRVVAALARRSGAAVMPILFTGRNSALFYGLGRIWYRFRLLMLARELLRMQGRHVELIAGRPLSPGTLPDLDDAALTDHLRLHCYLLARQPDREDPGASASAPVSPMDVAPLRAPTPRARIEGEIDALPPARRLLEHRDCVVGWAMRSEVPGLFAEIGRERERTFRVLDEGSGSAEDIDDFDHDYIQLFCWDRAARTLVGAYRMGPMDRLRAQGRTGYLAQMFDFDDAFYRCRPPTLELGRSFIVPEYQRSRYALDQLWRGIGAFLRTHPHYGMLYGTVSLTTQYDPRSIAMICDTLVEETPQVRPRHPLSTHLPPDWYEFRSRHQIDLLSLGRLVAAREHDGKGLPILLRHYAAMGACFHAVGVDPNFAATPGLLLSVDLQAIPEAKRTRYLS